MQLAVVGMAAMFALGSVLVAAALRDLLGDLIDVLRDSSATDAEIDAAIDDIEARQDEFWWLNLVSLAPFALLAAMAVWTNRVAKVAVRLGYPARHSTGWAAGGWFVPVVNLWFPYQSIVDSISPMNTARGRVLTWWLLYVLGAIAALPVLAVGMFGEGSLVGVALLPIVVAIAQAVAGLQVVAIVHADHEAAVASRAAATGP
jgi:hypothetical protein